MRTSFSPPSVESFLKLFDTSRVKGGGLDDIILYKARGRGGGLLSFLGGMARKAIPFLLNTFAPGVLQYGQNVLNDVNNGIALKNSARNRGVESLKGVGQKLLSGGSRKIGLKRMKFNNKRKWNI